jgi:hypothetical protein
MSESKPELDLDALERLLGVYRETRSTTIFLGIHAWELDALIQRVRELETAPNRAWLDELGKLGNYWRNYVADEIAKREDRIAALERVREAADGVVSRAEDLELNSGEAEELGLDVLRAALVALEEKP